MVNFPDIDLDVTRQTNEHYRWVADDYGSVNGETTWTVGFRRDNWNVRTVTRTTLECTKSDFILHAALDGYEGEHRTLSRNWELTVPRDLV